MKIKDLSQKKGVSRKTASLVLNGHFNAVSVDTIKKILWTEDLENLQIQETATELFRDMMEYVITNYRGKNKKETIKLAVSLLNRSFQLEKQINNLTQILDSKTNGMPQLPQQKE